jgi:hypothetical protein
MKTTMCGAAAALWIGLGAVSPAAAHDAAGGPAKLGKVHFKVECNAAAQKDFDLAMAYYHSFAWNDIKAPLDRTLQADPECGMAHWARALALLDNPFGWPGNVSAKTLADGAALLEAARQAGLKTQRERDYVDALASFYRDPDKLNHRTRAKALETALEGIARRNPDDTEAAILHALVLSANFDPADKQYTNQLRAAAILEPLFKAQPEHPGVAHYLIHSYDYPPIASKGLDAARRYDKIAPDAPHAQHMPSHIFTRVGAWRESIASNIASARTDAGKSAQTHHAYDYMAYAYLQLGQDAAARKVMADLSALPGAYDSFAAAYAYAAIPARLAIELGAWQEAAALSLVPASVVYPWNKYPQAEAVNAFARGLGAAAGKNAGAAQIEVTRLQQLRDAATALKLSYWAEQIDIQSEVVRGLAAFGDGKRDDGIDILRKAAVREDASEKHVVTPGPIIPAREVLAGALFDMGKPAEALSEFEAVLRKEPNRLRATAGAAMAAERSGDTAKARLYHSKVLELTEGADGQRPEIVQARRFLGRA